MLCHLICEWYIDGSLVRAFWEGKKLISRWAMGKLFGRSGICYQKNAFRAHEIVTVESFTKIWSRGRFHVSKSRHLFAGSNPERKPFTWLRAELFVFQKLNGAIPYPYDCDYWTYLRWFFFLLARHLLWWCHSQSTPVLYGIQSWPITHTIFLL